MPDTLTREMKRMALRPAREADRYDKWGFALGQWFAIAEVAYHADADLPPEWQFRHGMAEHDPIGNWHPDHTPCPLADESDRYKNWGTEEWPEYECHCTEEREYVPFLDAGEAGIEMLIYAGRVIDRYCRRVKAAGLDY